ncbi:MULTISPECIES: cob(I)yrinic acid a,c-diamide adenosyltransferase [Pseudanabaena]|uniref:Cob(I)yrinic acid a,c-diamide adenosyltransferase n=2 Tax=Pseudanabaena TaxID=1152 RepID=L8N768_9CYAN|nr:MULTISPECIES: cob(I)yrinic acid a,c-diamide adenosyltransferase [Pseudanabaena]ELS34078.1 cob(I)yrinic acid a,c-diamide adenosyltransferase [Pseudanabaena biceps PCC 7429]MDG3493740.1 cob(I)yrinic acid a,c-diamide adenosyltransferase [Pseudanabaena catenata USMAC16]
MVAQIKTTQIETQQTKNNHDRPNQTKTNSADSNSLKGSSIVTPLKGNVQVFIAPHRNLYADIIAQALRVAGQGTQVLLVQLFQTGINQGLNNPRRLVENFEWMRCDAQRDLSRHEIVLTDAEKIAVLDLWDYAKVAIKSSPMGLVVIDEVDLLVERSLISEEELLHVLETRSPKVNIILTGSSMPSSISDYADQVTHRRN